MLLFVIEVFSGRQLANHNKTIMRTEITYRLCVTIRHLTSIPSRTKSEGLKQRVSMVRAAFNPKFTIEHLVAEGDKVAVMWSNRGAHVGDWFGFSPTGKSVTAHGVDIHLLRDGRLAEHWDVVDISEFLMTVGAASAPAEAAGAQR